MLDFYTLIDADSGDDVALMRPLTEDEIRSWAPDGRPTHEQWNAALRQLLDPIGRGIGRCTVLYRDGVPVEVGYWGCTADLGHAAGPWSRRRAAHRTQRRLRGAQHIGMGE